MGRHNRPRKSISEFVAALSPSESSSLDKAIAEALRIGGPIGTSSYLGEPLADGKSRICRWFFAILPGHDGAWDSPVFLTPEVVQHLATERSIVPAHDPATLKEDQPWGTDEDPDLDDED